MVVVLVAGITLWQNRNLADGNAPPLAGTRTDGSFVALGTEGSTSTHRTAQLVVFWATWCGVCRAEAGNIESVAKAWPVVSVAMQSGERQEVAKYLASKKLGVPAIADDDADIADAWGVKVVPAHFVIDPQGNIRFRILGYTTTFGLRARLWWAQNIAA